METRRDLARQFEALYLLVEGDVYEPRVRHGDVIQANPHAEPRVGQEVLAIRADGTVHLGDILARCEDGAFNLRTPKGDFYRLRAGEVTFAPVTGIWFGKPDFLNLPTLAAGSA